MKNIKYDPMLPGGRICGLRVNGLLSGRAVISDPFPAFSWRYQDTAPGFRQKAYRLLAEDERGEVLWDSGWVESRNSQNIRWGGKGISSRSTVFWQVMARGFSGEELISEKVCFEAPLLKNADWQARWISFTGNNPEVDSPIPHFRKEFVLASAPRKARLYVAARGIAIPALNGRRIGGDHLAPGWTDYAKQIQYVTYDVTEYLQAGPNALGVRLGDGWYCGLFSGRRRNIYGSPAEVMMQLEYEDTQGILHQVVTEEGWKCASGPTLRSSIYDGEEYDARKELTGWDLPGFDDSQWQVPAVGDTAENSPELVPKCCLPVRKMREIKPVAVLHPDPEITIFDFGQNLAGVVRLSVKSPRGRGFTLRFAEMLTQSGMLYTANYRSARSTDYYYAAGNPEGDQWEPEFTYHGFRYVQVDGQQCGGCSDLELTALVLYSDLEETGSFECSNAKLNRLYQNVIWGQRSNFVEIPTDCPQRDERLGWTGDAQVFCGTAARNMQVEAFF
ncbi:MAG: family 78 glycoside hydrolase catalytic domain, partial [Lentisphaeria bacterium]|nr:family 78 glycoside hydrolase catalytic domain [Lentisphaeria bacterium]